MLSRIASSTSAGLKSGAFRQGVATVAARGTASNSHVRTTGRAFREGKSAVALCAMPTRSFSSMFCYQCEQTESQKGCTVVGVCGKTPETAKLQDLLIEACKGICQYTHRINELGAPRLAEVDHFVLQAVFSTLTNVNFDSSRFVVYLQEAEKHLATAREAYSKACAAKGMQPEKLTGPALFKMASKTDIAMLEEQAQAVGVLEKKAALGEDYTGLEEMIVYGLKGTCAYFEHAVVLGAKSDEVMAGIAKAFDFVALPGKTVPQMLEMAMFVGQVNLKGMELLEAGHIKNFGTPVPTNVPVTPIAGKCIVVSGHDLKDLEILLKQTEGKGINVYTHGEMLPAHGYPGLHKYKHLVGNYGTAWQNQKLEFATFPGPIVMTSNCIIQPMKSYQDRIYTRSFVGFPKVAHLDEPDFSPVIAKALASPGFPKTVTPQRQITTGIGRETVLSLAAPIVDAVKKGDIERFYVIGGCDGSENQRSYFKDLALRTSDKSVVLTLGCGKYRFNHYQFGNVPNTGVPRLVDMGQCNDAYGAIQVAVALSNVFKTDVNGLPLSFAVSWFEQKAVAVLLTLLSLGVKNIRLGPHLPAFATPAILSVLKDKFALAPISTPDADFGQFNLKAEPIKTMV